MSEPIVCNPGDLKCQVENHLSNIWRTELVGFNQFFWATTLWVVLGVAFSYVHISLLFVGDEFAVVGSRANNS